MRKVPIALLLILLAAAPATARDDFEWALDQGYEFLAFHDPGYLVLKDSAGKTSELTFSYQGLTYQVVKTWPQGKTIRVTYSPEKGTEVLDPGSGKRYPIHSARPRIDELQSRCLAQNGTTAGMSRCYSSAATAWDLELNRAYQRVMNSDFPEETKRAIRTAQRKWIEFRDASMAAIRTVGSEKDGSIRVLEAGSAAVTLTRDQALTLQGYLE